MAFDPATAFLMYTAWNSAYKFIDSRYKSTKRKTLSPNYKVRDDDIKLSAETALPIPYGTNKINGQIIYREDTVASKTDMAIAFCEGEVDNIGYVRFDNVYADKTNKITVTKYTGTTTQSADDIFTSGVFNTECYQNVNINSQHPDSNYYIVGGGAGSTRSSRFDSPPVIETTLKVQKTSGTEIFRGYMDFDLSGYPENLTVTDAKITVNHQGLTNARTTSCAVPGDCHIYAAATSSAIVNTELTWNTKPTDLYVVSNDGDSLGDSSLGLVEYKFTSTGIAYLQSNYDTGTRPIFYLGISNTQSTALHYFSAKESQFFSPQLTLGYSGGTPCSFRNTAYIAATVDTTENKLVSPESPNVTAVIRGRKIKHWNTLENVWEVSYNTNPVWILYDLFTNGRYALDLSTTLIDVDSFKDAAEYCDEVILNDDGNYVIRYECNGVIDSNAPLSSYIDDILITFLGFLYEKDGKIHCGCERALTLNADFALDMDNIVAGSFSYTQLPREEMPNRIKILFTDAQQDYEQTYLTVSDEADIEDRGEVLLEVPAYYIQSKSQASRIARHLLLKSKYGKYTFKCRVSVNQAHILAGERCSVTHTVAGWTAKDFRITSIRETADDEIEVEGEEYIASLFDNSLDAGIVSDYDEMPTIANKWDLPIAESLTLTETYRTNDDGSYQPQINVAWTEPDYVLGKDRLEYYIYWRSNSGTYADRARFHAYQSPIQIDVPGADTYYVKIETFVYPDFYMPDSSLAPEDSIAIVGLGLGTYPQSNGFTWSTAGSQANWTTGKIVYKGAVYSINSGNTTDAYIWFDPLTSTTVLQHSNTQPSGYDADLWLMAYYDSTAVTLEIAESGKIIHAGLIKVGTLIADIISSGTITSKTITLATTGGADCYFNAGKTQWDNTQTGFILGIDNTTPKFYIGDTTNYLNWTGAALNVAGAITITGGSGISNLSDAGSLAVLDSVGASNCDTTIIDGGKIITGLLTADNITTGTLTGREVQTATAGGERLVMHDTASGVAHSLEYYDSAGNAKLSFGNITHTGGVQGIWVATDYNLRIGSTSALSPHVAIYNGTIEITDTLTMFAGSTAYIDDIDLDGSITMDSSETVDGVDVSAHTHGGAGQGGTVAYSSLGSIPSTFAPSAHASSHNSGGSDVLSLSNLGGSITADQLASGYSDGDYLRYDSAEGGLYWSAS